MNQPIILLVEDDAKLARKVASAIAAKYPCDIVHMKNGEDAVLWVSAHDCDLCLLDYDLPRIDGLETLARIHQRKPNLPVVMLSGVGSEQVAVQAFHARVVDYVPKRAGFESVVVELVHQLLSKAPRITETAPTMIGPIIPQVMLHTTYQNRLRVIGRQLDLYGYRAITLLEVAGGFLVRGMPEGGRVPDALEFPDPGFPQLVRDAFSARGKSKKVRTFSPLLPTGYEDFLRALGYKLDTDMAEAITVSELAGMIAAGGVMPIDTSNALTIAPMQWLLRADNIKFLLDDAFRRRGRSTQLNTGLLGSRTRLNVADIEE